MIRRVEVLVVGAGPAGLAAATAASRAGAQVVVLDDNASAGGQIWRGGVGAPMGTEDSAKERALRAFRESRACLLPGRRVIDAQATGTLRAFVEASGAIEDFVWSRLILGTGARERFLPFPGWTLPGVYGAGGLQALVKGGYSVAGKRVVVAGTGPLLPAVAAHLLEAGADIVTVAEQARLGSMLAFAAKLWSRPGKLLQGVRFGASLRRVPYRIGCWPIFAEGDQQLTAVRLTDGRRTWSVPCDLLACGFHLVANTELATLLGCAHARDFVAVDAAQTTSQRNIYCAGEPTGIAGLDAALLEGQIAGLQAANQPRQAAALYRRRDREQVFGRDLEKAFALRVELRSLAAPDTIVCRCEDVRYGQLQSQTSWTDAKLQTRCGMGACQGRICGPAVQTLFGWHNSSIRPPLFPVPLSALMQASCPSANESKQLQETL